MIFERVFRYKDILWYRTIAHLKCEARQNYLGYLWFLMEPAMMTGIFYLIFGVFSAQKGPDYVIFLVIGLIAWQWLDTSLNEGMMGIKSKLHILNEIALPKYLFPFVHVLVTTTKFICVFCVVLLFIWARGYWPTGAYIYLPFIFSAQFILILGITLPLSILATYTGDVLRITQTLLRLLFFLSGIFYTSEIVPAHLKTYFYLNPMVGLIESYRSILLNGVVPARVYLLYPLLVGSLCLTMGALMCHFVDKRILKTVSI